MNLLFPSMQQAQCTKLWTVRCQRESAGRSPFVTPLIRQTAPDQGGPHQALCLCSSPCQPCAPPVRSLPSECVSGKQGPGDSQALAAPSATSEAVAAGKKGHATPWP